MVRERFCKVYGVFCANACQTAREFGQFLAGRVPI
jgi:hypothetical protein